MPFKSKAQQRFAYGTKQPWTKEFSDETKKLKKGKKRGFQALPDRVKKSQLSTGAYKAARKLTSKQRINLKADIAGKVKRNFQGTTRFKQKNAGALEALESWPKATDSASKVTGVKSNVAHQTMNTHPALSGAELFAPTGFTTKYGGRKGKASIFINQDHASVLTAKENKQVFQHELAHATPKRSSFRLAQIVSNPSKLGAEEARADRVVPTKGTRIGYDKLYKTPNGTYGTPIAQVRSYKAMRRKFNQMDKNSRKFAMSDKVNKSNVEKKDRNASGSALAAGGALTAGTGLVGGGIPGVHSNSSTIASMREGPMMQRTGAAMSSLRGGIFGYRTDAHTKALNRFRDDIKWNSGVNPNPKLQDAFNRGRTAGKIGPEVEVIRHLKTGRLISHGLLGAGAAATAVGVHQAKKSKVKKNDPAIDRYNGALLGAGSTAAVGSVAAKKILGGQAKRWKAKEATNLEAAQKIVPGLKTDMSSNDAARDWKKVFPFKTREQAAKAGELRGAASQARYFSHVYDGAAKVAGKIRNPAIAAAAVGGGGLLLHRQGQVKKSQPTAYTPKKQTKSDYRNKTALNTGIAGALGGSYGYRQMTTPNPRLGGRTLAETPILKPEFLDFKYKKENKPFKAQEKWENRKTKFEAKNMGTMNESTKSTYDKVRNLAERGSTPGERSNAAHQAKKLEDKHNFKPFTEPKPEIPKGVSKPVRNIIKHPKTVGTAVGAGMIAAPVFATSHLLNRHRYKSDLRAAKKQVSKAHIVSAFGVEYC